MAIYAGHSGAVATAGSVFVHLVLLQTLVASFAHKEHHALVGWLGLSFMEILIVAETQSPVSNCRCNFQGIKGKDGFPKLLELYVDSQRPDVSVVE